MRYDYIHPYMMVDGEVPAPDFSRADYDDAIVKDSAQEYEQADLVYVPAGSTKVQKCATAVAAEVTGLALAGADWHQPHLPPADPREEAAGLLHWFLRRGVPLNHIPIKNEFVFSYQGDAADGADKAFAAADEQAVKGAAQRDLVFNASEGCLTVRSTSASPAVQLIRVLQGVVGDSNVRVVARILADRLR